MENGNDKIRGQYLRTRKKMVSDMPRNFFHPVHEKEGHFITYADAFERRSGMISIQYKIQGENKQFRIPRWKTAFLDDQGIDRARFLVEEWKRANKASY